MLKLTKIELQWVSRVLEREIEPLLGYKTGEIHPLRELHRDNLISVKSKFDAELARRIDRDRKKIRENTR